MLAGKRPFSSTFTVNKMLIRLPEWMKMRQPDSVGSRYLNAIFGTELDLLSRNLEIYSKTTNIIDSPTDTPTKFYSVELDYPFASGYIYPIDTEGNRLDFKITAVDTKLSFLSNSTTRFEMIDQISPSGLSGNIAGMEWIYGYPSGILTIQQDIDPITPSSTLYYINYAVDNTLELIPFSGDAFGRGYIGLNKNSSYEILSPEPEWSLKKKYKMGYWITASGVDVTETPSGVTNQYSSYIDKNGDKTYYYRGYNNLYGSGVFNQADVKLTYNPISGTCKIYDIQNLTTSGTPYEIPSSGLNIYHYASGLSNGVWEYKGYNNPIPYDQTPQEIIENVKIANGGTFTEIIPSSIANTSWRFLPSGGYVDNEVYPHSGTFDWIDGTGGIGNIIRFSGGISKYQAEYEYRLHSNIKQISIEPKNSYNSVSLKNGSLYFIKDNNYYKELNLEPSKSDPLAMRIDPDIIRPGTNIGVKITFAHRRYETWKKANTIDKTIQLIRHNIGAFDDFGSY